eukprot:TRINITY_DN4094_c0_g1_i1.p1 TRINITY_DN4094_c0_g1~~TRINITY_DN4094_c0_g1_i1.p1  ORF type:complete len:1176 (+),score=110.92 TRINITY_DN4094_c0_g1_i1:1223-4750(+)
MKKSKIGINEEERFTENSTLESIAMTVEPASFPINYEHTLEVNHGIPREVPEIEELTVEEEICFLEYVTKRINTCEIYKEQEVVTKVVDTKRDKDKGIIKMVNYSIFVKEKPAGVLTIKFFPDYKLRKMLKTLNECFIQQSLGPICKSPILAIKAISGSESIPMITFISESTGLPLDKCGLTFEEALIAMSKLLNTLAILEELGVSHLRISPKNILWDANRRCIRIRGFSAAKICCHSSQMLFDPLVNNEVPKVKQEMYAPYELCTSSPNKIIPQKVDAFSFGVLLAKVLSNQNEKASYTDLINELAMKPSMRPWIDIIKSCTAYNKETRPSFSQLKATFEKTLTESGYSHIIEREIFNLGKLLPNAHLTKIWVLRKRFESMRMNKKAVSEVVTIQKELAQEYFTLQYFEMAIKHAENVLKLCSPRRNPQFLSIYYILGTSHFHLCQYQTALGYYKEMKRGILTVPPSPELKGLDSLCTAAIGKVYTKLGYYEAALECFEKLETVSTVYPEIAEAYLGLCSIPMAEKHIEKARGKTDAAKFNELLGDYHETICNYNKSLTHYNSAIFEAIADLAHSQLWVAGICEKIGSVYAKLADYDKALTYINTALQINKNYYGETHTKLTSVYKILGMYYLYKSDYRESLHWLKLAESIASSTFQFDPAFIGELYHLMGKVYISISSYDQAAAILCKSEEYFREILKGNHVKIAALYLSLSELYIIQGDSCKAKQYLYKALNLLIPTFGQKHALVADAYHFLGDYYHYVSGEYKKALEHYIKAEEIRGKIFDRSHPGLISIQNCIGSVHLSLGNIKEGSRYIEKAFVNYKTHYPFKEQELAVISYNLGRCCIASAYYNEAIGYFNKAIKVLSEDEGYWLVLAYNGLGDIYIAMGEYVKAIEYYEKALEVTNITHALKSSTYCAIGKANAYLKNYENATENYKVAKKYANSYGKLKVYLGLAEVCEHREEFNEALEWLEKVEEVSAKQRKVTSELAIAYNQAGCIFHKLARFTKALDYFNKCIKLYGGETAQVCRNMASTYIAMENYEKALQLYTKAVQICEVQATPMLLRAIYGDMIRTYNKWGKYEEAVKCGGKISLGNVCNEEAIVNLNLADAYKHLKNYTKALECLKRAESILQAVNKEDNDLTYFLYKALEEIYRNKGDKETAAKYQKEVEYLSFVST